MAHPDEPPLPDLLLPSEAMAQVPAGQARKLVLSQLLSDVYRASAPPLRARLLECLLRPVRPLGLVAVAAGAFGSLVHRETWSGLSISVDDALRYSADQVFELARYVGQLQQVLNVLRDEYLLADVVGDGTPAWEKWAEAQGPLDALEEGAKAIADELSTKAPVPLRKKK